MDAGILQDFGGGNLPENETIVLILGIVFLALGLLLAFMGRRLWKHLMDLIGGLIGAVLGWSIGVELGGEMMGLILSILFAFVLGSLFFYLARIGIAFIAGVLGYAVVVGLTGSQGAGFVVAFILFIVTLVFSESWTAVITAFVGSLIVGFSLYLFDLDIGIVIAALLLVFASGTAVQMAALKEEQRMKQARAAAVQRSGRYEEPPPPPPD